MQSGAFQQINRSCLNNSSSKQLFSFPKQRRFYEGKKNLISQTDFILPSFSEGKNQAKSFSRTKRELVFENQRQLNSRPSPNAYQNPSSLKLSNSGISMAIKLKENTLKHISKVPGPGAYSTRSLDRQSKSILFPKDKRQFKFPMENQKGKDSPGPYFIKTERLKAILSNYQNPKLTKISKKTNKSQLEVLKMKIKAQENTKLSKLPKPPNPQVISSFKKSILLKRQKTVVFDKEIRKSYFDVKNENPASANYQYFSEFANRNKPDTLESSRRSMNIKVGKDFKERLRTLSVHHEQSKDRVS